ncbi:hypothetical protein DPMN_193903 [Dreissena polymorpha]|uniref:Uncharacterized protein n=1 Tax=Dreissena polymorpha TaxID=45954 RepID=A0A9D3Y1S8_DREPO|nr:hypothetical protein DPMN_193903 [Dreissena polymorpha]
MFMKYTNPIAPAAQSSEECASAVGAIDGKGERIRKRSADSNPSKDEVELHGIL